MMNHDDLVMYIATKLERNEQRRAERIGEIPNTIDTFVDYKCKELDIRVTNSLFEVIRVYEIKRHGHIGKACCQLYSAREFLSYRQDTPIQLIYVSQWDDGKIRAKRIL